MTHQNDSGSQIIAGKYELVHALGEGGMGMVWRARHLSLGTAVAIKFLSNKTLAQPKAKERFRREARAASQLNHPNSIRVLDFGVDGKRHYLVMEYLDGYPLTRYLNLKGAFALKELVSVMTQLLSAIGAAHDMGIIHRDIKPDNVLISKGRDDRGCEYHIAKVCDFGLAKISGPAAQWMSQRDITRAGQVLGTPECMSPEQALGQKPDPRSDLYACGVLLFAMATGRLPFRADTTPDLLKQHIQDPPPRPGSINPEVSARLEEIILKALSKSAEDRQPSARVLSNELLMLIGADAPPHVVLELPIGIDNAVPDFSVESGIFDGSSTGGGRVDDERTILSSAPPLHVEPKPPLTSMAKPASAPSVREEPQAVMGPRVMKAVSVPDFLKELKPKPAVAPKAKAARARVVREEPERPVEASSSLKLNGGTRLKSPHIHHPQHMLLLGLAVGIVVGFVLGALAI